MLFAIYLFYGYLLYYLLTLDMWSRSVGARAEVEDGTLRVRDPFSYGIGPQRPLSPSRQSGSRGRPNAGPTTAISYDTSRGRLATRSWLLGSGLLGSWRLLFRLRDVRRGLDQTLRHDLLVAGIDDLFEALLHALAELFE